MSTELDLAGRVVDLTRQVAGPAAQAEVFVLHTAAALTRFANSAIHQNVADVATRVRLRLHVDGRTAVGSTTRTGSDALRALVERTVAAARVCPPDPAWAGLAATADVTAAADGYDEATAQAAPSERAARVRAFVDAADGLETAGYCRTTYWSGAFGNTAGQTGTGRAAEAAMDGVARQRDADGVARLSTRQLALLDGAVLGARAAAKARAAAEPVELPAGRYEVVLEPTAVADLLQNLAFYGFNGKAYADGQSFVEPDAAQFDPAVTLIDDPCGPIGSDLPFDAEGTPRRRLVLVESGVSRSVCHDRRTAAQVGTGSTGHAQAGAATWGPMAAALRLEPAATGRPATGAAPVVDPAARTLIAGVQRGLLVTDLWYTRVLDPRSLVVTGLTRNGMWLIEDGEVTAAVRNLRFTQSYPRALEPGRVGGIGPTATTLPDSWGTARWSAPALHLKTWNFTGGAAG